MPESLADLSSGLLVVAQQSRWRLSNETVHSN
jgi:hypothetical protein